MRKLIATIVMSWGLLGPGPANFVGLAAAAAPDKSVGAETRRGVAEAEHEEGVPLSFKEDLAFWSLVTFVIFIWLLGRFAWKPLIAGLDRREARIRDDIDQAEAARAKAEQMLAEHAQKLAKVQDEVREILAAARRDAEHSQQEIIAAAQKEADASKQRAISEINRARDAALKDLFDVMANEVARATEHVLGRTVTASDQQRLIDEALAQFPQASAAS
jgi:F-type H+-transporting ATPase subunit b